MTQNQPEKIECVSISSPAENSLQKEQHKMLGRPTGSAFNIILRGQRIPSARFFTRGYILKTLFNTTGFSFAGKMYDPARVFTHLSHTKREERKSWALFRISFQQSLESMKVDYLLRTSC